MQTITVSAQCSILQTSISTDNDGTLDSSRTASDTANPYPLFTDLRIELGEKWLLSDVKAYAHPLCPGKCVASMTF